MFEFSLFSLIENSEIEKSFAPALTETNLSSWSLTLQETVSQNWTFIRFVFAGFSIIHSANSNDSLDNGKFKFVFV